MDYKQSKTPYLSIMAAMALIAGITHTQPDRKLIHVSIEPSTEATGATVQITGLQYVPKTNLTTQTEEPHENSNNSPDFGLD
ncbi:MAG: hypothetical protein HEP71_09430 [Roseivirga sp.]|nr:hypothetical protein [Roseivirga sp.]